MRQEATIEARSDTQTGMMLGLGHAPEPPPARVWLVDDHNEIRELLRRLLERSPGIDCERDFCSASGMLMALSRETPPDVVLLDLNLGPENGIEAIGLIKKFAPATQVLILTTLPDTIKAAEARRAGAAGFLLKGDTFGSIVERIQEAARKAKWVGLARAS